MKGKVDVQMVGEASSIEETPLQKKPGVVFANEIDRELNGENSIDIEQGSMEETLDESENKFLKSILDKCEDEDALVLLAKINQENGEQVGPTSIIPCLDENDDGVPPFFRFPACPLDPRNRCFNTSKFALMFGNLGFPYFDRSKHQYEIYLHFSFSRIVIEYTYVYIHICACRCIYILPVIREICIILTYNCYCIKKCIYSI